jgi:hypothetical protein
LSSASETRLDRDETIRHAVFAMRGRLRCH